MNRNYVDFTTDSVLLRAVSLADRHGSNRDRVRARYLLGCAYRDMGEAPQALDCYHQAIDIADTTSTDSAYLVQIAKIHGQAGDLFQRQSLPRNAIQEYMLGWKCAIMAKDTATALLIYGQIDGCYFNMHDYDSAIAVSNRTRGMLLARGDTLTANTFVAADLAVALSNGHYDDAGPLLDLYEHHSVLALGKSNASNYKMLFLYKAQYAQGTHQIDSASYYLYRFWQEAQNEEQKLLATANLFSFYCDRRQCDSIKKIRDGFSIFGRKESLPTGEGAFARHSCPIQLHAEPANRGTVETQG